VEFKKEVEREWNRLSVNGEEFRGIGRCRKRVL
jgi:hypothetical protein